MEVLISQLLDGISLWMNYEGHVILNIKLRCSLRLESFPQDFIAYVSVGSFAVYLPSWREIFAGRILRFLASIYTYLRVLGFRDSGREVAVYCC